MWAQQACIQNNLLTQHNQHAARNRCVIQLINIKIAISGDADARCQVDPQQTLKVKTPGCDNPT